MLEKSFGLLFYLKQPKNPNTLGKFIYLRITVDGVAKETSTKRIWYSDRWNQSYGRATGNKEDAKMLNIFLETLTAKIHQAKLSLLELNKSITAETIKNIITGNVDDRKKLLSIFKYHNEQIEALVAKGEYSPLTLKRFKTTYSHTAAFIKSKYNADDIDIRDLNYEFVSEYSFWLKTTKNCAHNSVMKYISTVKKIVIECIRKKWLREDPFSEFKTTQKEVEIIPLDNNDLRAISKKKIEVERLALVRDIFLFSCYRPDFIIEVKQKGCETKYVILDAKYKRIGTIENFDYQELTLKYLHGISLQTGGYLPVLGLFIINPIHNSGVGYYQKNEFSLIGKNISFPLIGRIELGITPTSHNHFIEVFGKLFA